MQEMVNRESLMEGNSNQQTAISKYKILCMGAKWQETKSH